MNLYDNQVSSIRGVQGLSSEFEPSYPAYDAMNDVSVALILEENVDYACARERRSESIRGFGCVDRFNAGSNPKRNRRKSITTENRPIEHKVPKRH